MSDDKIEPIWLTGLRSLVEAFASQAGSLIADRLLAKDDKDDDKGIKTDGST